MAVGPVIVAVVVGAVVVISGAGLIGLIVRIVVGVAVGIVIVASVVVGRVVVGTVVVSVAAVILGYLTSTYGLLIPL